MITAELIGGPADGTVVRIPLVQDRYHAPIRLQPVKHRPSVLCLDWVVYLLDRDSTTELPVRTEFGYYRYIHAESLHPQTART